MTLPAADGGPSRGGAGVEAVTFPPRTGSRVRSALFSTTTVVGVGALGVLDPHLWVAWVLLACQLPFAVIRWLVVREAAQRAWAVAVAASGVWWDPQGPPMAWASVARIEVHSARGLRRLLPHVDRVLFVDHAGADFARRARTQAIGRSVLLDRVRTTPEAVVAACRPFTDAPASLRLR